MNISNIQNLQTIDTVKINTQINFNDKNGKTTAVEPVERVDRFEKESEVSESVTYEPQKKLTTDEVNALSRERLEAAASIVTDTVEQNVVNQASQTAISHNGYELSTASADFLTEIFGSLENALPTPATTPEGALEDISEGGAYSVEAVSERIMLMATSISGNNQEVIAKMEEAVKQGFEAAGLNLETGEGMPDITMDTYKEVLRQFDILKGTQVESSIA